MPKDRLIICHFVSSTVDSHFFSNLGRGLAEKGFSTLWAALFETNKETPQWIKETDHTNYYCLNAKGRKNFPNAVWKLVSLLRQKKVDILHTHLYDAGLLGVVAARISKIPVIVSRHHLDLVHLVGSKVHIEIDRSLTKFSNLTIVPTIATRDFMVEHERLDKEKIKVINYGFDFQQFSVTDQNRQKVRSEFGFTDEFVIGCVGHLQENKGQGYLLEALAKVAGKIPKARVLLLGREAERKFIDEIIAGNNLAGKVVFGGYRKDVAACMKAMDVLVHPSLSESFSQVIVEAMLVRTPVIATPCGVAPEIIKNGETGFLVGLKNADDIADSLIKLYNNPDLAEKMANAARAIAQEKFTLERFINAHIDCYNLLAENGRKF